MFTESQFNTNRNSSSYTPLLWAAIGQHSTLAAAVVALHWTRNVATMQPAVSRRRVARAGDGMVLRTTRSLVQFLYDLGVRPRAVPRASASVFSLDAAREARAGSMDAGAPRESWEPAMPDRRRA